MDYDEGTFPGVSGLALFYRRWRPHGEPRAVLVRLQGIGGHSGMYQPFVDAVVPNGYAVYGLDLRGHGRSAGRRGHISSWCEYREDLRRFLRVVGAAEPGHPRFLVGFSLGGIVVLDYALEHPEDLHGVVALSPTLAAGVPRSKWLLARLLSGLWPTFSTTTGLDRTNLTRDQAAARRLLYDPLAFHTATARFATEVFAAQARVQARAAELAVPLLILLGAADRQALPGPTRRFFEQVRFADKEMHIYPGAYHFLDWEMNREEVFADCVGWLDRHLPASAAPALSPVLVSSSR